MCSTFPSEAELLLERLDSYKHDKWGWVFYRCTYGDDEAWARFQQIINEKTRMFSARHTELFKRLEWTFVSDPATLNGATREQLRRRFRAWAAEAIWTEQPRATPESEARLYNIPTPRYSVFIQVDEESLRSVIEADPKETLDVGWVNLVRADDDVNNLIDDPEIDDREIDDREIDDPVIGDMSWMRISINMLEPGGYEVLAGDEDSWHLYYVSPPDVCIS